MTLLTTETLLRRIEDLEARLDRILGDARYAQRQLRLHCCRKRALDAIDRIEDLADLTPRHS
jgi:hypothetical protein